MKRRIERIKWSEVQETISEELKAYKRKSLNESKRKPEVITESDIEDMVRTVLRSRKRARR